MARFVLFLVFVVVVLLSQLSPSQQSPFLPQTDADSGVVREVLENILEKTEEAAEQLAETLGVDDDNDDNDDNDDDLVELDTDALEDLITPDGADDDYEEDDEDEEEANDNDNDNDDHDDDDDDDDTVPEVDDDVLEELMPDGDPAEGHHVEVFEEALEALGETAETLEEAAGANDVTGA